MALPRRSRQHPPDGRQTSAVRVLRQPGSAHLPGGPQRTAADQERVVGRDAGRQQHGDPAPIPARCRLDHPASRRTLGRRHHGVSIALRHGGFVGFDRRGRVTQDVVPAGTSPTSLTVDERSDLDPLVPLGTSRAVLDRALGGTRTRTAPILSRSPLPIGLRGPARSDAMARASGSLPRRWNVELRLRVRPDPRRFGADPQPASLSTTSISDKYSDEIGWAGTLRIALPDRPTFRYLLVIHPTV